MILSWTISTDFPFAQNVMRRGGIDKVKVVSDVLEAEMGLKYGLLVKERRYLRRAVFVVDREGKLTYVAYMPHNGQEPNYDEVIAEAKKALG
jgi:thiol peroxidase